VSYRSYIRIFIKNKTDLTINIVCAIPNRNPVVKRKKLLLSLHFHFCVYPSINNGVIKIGMYHQNRNDEIINRNGRNKYPTSMAVHLAQSGKV
jgi:hypothetical protein